MPDAVAVAGRDVRLPQRQAVAEEDGEHDCSAESAQRKVVAEDAPEIKTGESVPQKVLRRSRVPTHLLPSRSTSLNIQIDRPLMRYERACRMKLIKLVRKRQPTTTKRTMRRARKPDGSSGAYTVSASRMAR